MKKLTVFAYILAVLVFLAPQDSRAGVTVVQALSFGHYAIRSNNAQNTIIINPDGSHSFTSAGFVEISPPQEGIYDIDGLPASSVITSIVLTQTQPLIGGSTVFQMVNLQETHTNTNGSGVARIHLGGTARTSGDGSSYSDATYTGYIDVQINF